MLRLCDGGVGRAVPQVTAGPVAVEESPLAELEGWLAAVVVLAALCLVLAALLAVFVKKAQGRAREAQPNVQKRALTPFKKVRLHPIRPLIIYLP